MENLFRGRSSVGVVRQLGAGYLYGLGIGSSGISERNGSHPSHLVAFVVVTERQPAVIAVFLGQNLPGEVVPGFQDSPEWVDEVVELLRSNDSSFLVLDENGGSPFSRNV